MARQDIAVASTPVDGQALRRYEQTDPHRLERRRHRQRRRRRPAGRPARLRCLRRARLQRGGAPSPRRTRSRSAHRCGVARRCSTRSSPRWPTTCRRRPSRPACSAVPPTARAGRALGRSPAPRASPARAGRRPGAALPAPARRSPTRRRSRPIANELLPRATLVTPNRREAAALLAGSSDRRCPASPARCEPPARSRSCITGGDSDDALALDWLAQRTRQRLARLPRIDTRAQPRHRLHRSPAARPRRWRSASSLPTPWCWRRCPPRTRCAMAARPARTPARCGARAGFAERSLVAAGDCRSARCRRAGRHPAHDRRIRLGLYAIVDSAERVEQVLAAGVRTIQLRIKTAAGHGCVAQRHPAQHRCVRATAGARLFVNDHWQLALELRRTAYTSARKTCSRSATTAAQPLRRSGLALGISSHSLWELARAKTLAPRYIACGPVWPTLTKAMPWRPQGLDNLAWWCADRRRADRRRSAASWRRSRCAQPATCGADGICIVRVLGEDPAARCRRCARRSMPADGRARGDAATAASKPHCVDVAAARRRAPCAAPAVTARRVTPVATETAVTGGRNGVTRRVLPRYGCRDDWALLLAHALQYRRHAAQANQTRRQETTAWGSEPPTIGIIANPVSARDIRRVIANASNLQITDRANIVLRVLAGLQACGVDERADDAGQRRHPRPCRAQPGARAQPAPASSRGRVPRHGTSPARSTTPSAPRA